MGKQEELRERNQHIASRYIAGETLQTIGADYNMSRQAVQQIIKRLSIPRRVKKGERSNITNVLKYNTDKHIENVIKDLFAQVQYYKKKFHYELTRNANMKRYYKDKLLSKIIVE